MSIDKELIEQFAEALEPLGTLTVRPMMGAATLYLDGTIFAVLADGELWFKADKESEGIWEEAGCERFTFTDKNGKVETMNYRRGPADIYDDAEAMQRWAGLAHEAGLRSAAKKKPRRKVSERPA